MNSETNDIGREIRNMRRLHGLLEMLADPDVKMDTPYVVWGKKVRGYEVEDYMQDSEDKP